MDAKLWIYAHYNSYSKLIEYQISSYERGESSGDVLIESRTISFETLEDKEAKVKLSSALKSKLASVRADHYQEQMNIQESINELLSLEYKPATDPMDDIPF